jgi:DNA-binding CsgD family transcriptional regulator
MNLHPGRLATMIAAIGSPGFGAAVLDLFDAPVGLVHGVAFEWRDGSPPRVLFAAARDPGEQAKTGAMVREWTAGDYRWDPVLASLDEIASASGRVRFGDARALGLTREHERFIERYYGSCGLGEEVDFVVREGGRLLVLSLCRRRGAAALEGRDREWLAALTPLMLAGAHQHASRLAPHEAAGALPASRPERLARVRTAMLAADCELTRREADVCAHIVLGYSAIATGLQLGISPQTVATHRKRAYAKLGVSSQTELFGLWHQAAAAAP